MAACGHCFTLVVTEDGGVCAWGLGQGGQLGLNNREVFHAPMVLVAAGGAHAAGVAAEEKTQLIDSARASVRAGMACVPGA